MLRHVLRLMHTLDSATVACFNIFQPKTAHANGHMLLYAQDRFLHQALAVAMVVCCLAVAIEAAQPQVYLASCVRAAGMMMQGLLFILIAHIRYEDHVAWDISDGDSAPFQYSKVSYSGATLAFFCMTFNCFRLNRVYAAAICSCSAVFTKCLRSLNAAASLSCLECSFGCMHLIRGRVDVLFCSVLVLPETGPHKACNNPRTCSNICFTQVLVTQTIITVVSCYIGIHITAHRVLEMLSGKQLS